MMTRFYDKQRRVELLPGVHDLTRAQVVELPDDNPFFHPVPSGQCLTFDAAGVPVGLKPYVTPQLTREQIDALRRAAYSTQCAPLLEEAQMKRHLNLPAAADALEAQAYQKRLAIQAEYPWPV